MLRAEYLQLAQQKLSKFASQDDFSSKMEIAFGSQLDRSKLKNLEQQWQQEDFTGLPPIEVLQNGELGTANGAYAAANQTIYISSTFLATANIEQIVSVLIEEIGHSVDTGLNIADSIGDEGALFSQLVQGNNLSASDITSLQSEDDRALVMIDGQQVWIEQNSVVGTSGNDTLVGVTNSGDIISGLAGNDSLSGLSGNDTLVGGRGSDTLTGGAGSDIFVLENFNDNGFAQNSDVVTDFVRGVDKIDVSGLGISDFSTILAITSNDASNSFFASAVIATYNNYGFNSSNYSLKLTGISRSSLVAADFNFATATTNDNLTGGANNDDLFGGFGDDTLNGGNGNDRLFGENGNDRLVGGRGSDTLAGGAGSDTFVLENFNDNGFAQNSDVVTDFVRGVDKIDVSGLGISDFSTILAITSNDASNSFFASAVIATYNNSSNYSLNLTGINRSSLVAADFNFATATTNDNLTGGDYDDDLFSGFGNDTLNGGNENDRLFGENGNDRLVGGRGSDTLTGGAGSDTFVLENFNDNGFAQNSDVVTDFVRGVDKIDVSGLGISDFSTILAITSNDASNSFVASAVITTYNNYGYFSSNYSLKLTGVDQGLLTVSDFNFATTTFNNELLGGANNDDLFGGLGNDALNGAAGDDRLFGENGNDRLVGGRGSDTLTGGAGSDTFVLENFNDNSFNKGSDVVTDFARGVDKIDVSGLGISDFSTILAITSNDASNSAVITTDNNGYFSSNYSLKLTGVDKELLTASDFNFATTTFNNELLGSAYRDDLFGGLGNDSLNGGADDDRLFGENGNDTLNGGGGKDSLYGGLGDDTYIVQNNLAGGTVIEDVGGNDTLQLSAVVNSTNGWRKSGTSLLLDLNADQFFNAYYDLTIKNFFNTVGGAGNGFIENLANLSGGAIVNQFRTTSNDFNNDKKSDILWRNDNGTVAVWTMNGATVTSSSLTSVPNINNSWKVAGTGDYNGDGNADILWRNDNGSVAVWAMNGSTVTSSSLTSVPNIDNSWKVTGTGDYNGDGKADILWRNDNGSIAVWTMNGSTVAASSLTSTPTIPSSWKIAASSDYTGDGKSDILWRNDDGTIALWQMNGAAVDASTAVAKVSTDWKIAGTGDFTGDGKADILWRNDNGSIAVWAMNGATVASSSLTSTSSLDLSWSVAGIGDYTGDGKADILWRNTNGITSVWEMNGATVASSILTSVITDGSSWKIAAPII